MEKIFLTERAGGCLIIAMSTGACWGGHCCVDPGIFVSNRAFLCRTMQFAVEPGFLVSDECYNSYNGIYAARVKLYDAIRNYLAPLMHRQDTTNGHPFTDQLDALMHQKYSQ